MAHTFNISTAETFKFIELVQNRPGIWDVTSKEYKNKHIKSLNKIEVAREMGAEWTEEDVQDKFNNLRTYYMKCSADVMKSKASGAGADDVLKPKWQFYNALDAFLKISTTPRKTVSNLPAIGEEDGASRSSTPPVAPMGTVRKRKRNASPKMTPF
ncbi:uncharacterized protein LOC135487127 [Lineus longissimus]|uniref:uncharacterized protein LOC135487127 n=1 Tax=Lineus longissimus TaxID=88925 RepID=UPI00315C590F